MSIPAGTALASPYPPFTPTVSAGAAAVAPGAALTLRVEGFCAGANVTYTIGSVTIGTALTGTAGSGSIPATAPSQPGTYTLRASSTTPCALSATSSLTVTAAAGTLPTTGTSTSPTLRIGGIVLGLGLALLLVVSIRRRPRLLRSR